MCFMTLLFSSSSFCFGFRWSRMGNGLSRPLRYSCYEVGETLSGYLDICISGYITDILNIIFDIYTNLIRSYQIRTMFPQSGWSIICLQVAHTWTPHCSAGALDVGWLKVIISPLNMNPLFWNQVCPVPLRASRSTLLSTFWLNSSRARCGCRHWWR